MVHSFYQISKIWRSKLGLVCIIFALFVYSTNEAQAQDKFIKGLFRVIDYSLLDSYDQENYLIGLIDGYLGSQILGGKSKKWFWLLNCIDGRPIVKIHTSVNSYIKDNPDVKLQDMYIVVLKVLHKICPAT